MKNFIQYVTREQKKVHYLGLIENVSDNTFSLEKPINEDHVISAVFIGGVRKTSVLLKPVEQALCTGIMTLDLIEDSEYHNVNRNLSFKEDDLVDFKNGGMGGDVDWIPFPVGFFLSVKILVT